MSFNDNILDNNLDEDFEFVSEEEIYQSTFLDDLMGKKLEVCIRPHLEIWKRGVITSYDVKRSTYQFQLDDDGVLLELPFHNSVFQIIPQEEEWIDLGENPMMMDSVLVSEVGKADFHLFCQQ